MKIRRFNWKVSDIVRKGLKFYLEWSARLRGQRFYCSALAGESEYNITVNCDLTVSCNCQDYNGSGHMGDLNKNSFQEVFFGPQAQHLRSELAKGKLPIVTCARCGDLKRVAKSQVKLMRPAAAGHNGNGVSKASQPVSTPTPHLFAGPEPRLPYRGMLLENTVRCNIDCIGCDRQSAARIRTTLQMDMAKLSRMADLVHELGLQQLFYLNLGEPFLSPNIGQELPLLREKNPDCRIVISTNGIILNTDAKREAALSASHLLFSIAGVSDAMLKKYERHGSFEKAYGNMKALVDYRNARGLARPLVVDAISFWPTHNPFYGYSFRYRLGFLDHVGIKSWKGREVDLRSEPVAA